METKKSLEYSTINFVYFTTNFPDNFIAECWKDNQLLKNHLQQKFKSDYISASDFLDWFFALDEENMKKLIIWIDENYNYRKIY